MVPHYLCRKFGIGLQYMANPTRNSNLLQIPLYSTASGQRTFKYRAVKIWNQLSADLKELSQAKVFCFKKDFIVSSS